MGQHFYFNGHTYEFVDTAYAWDAARTYAISRGAHLATISSSAEDAAIFNTASADASLLAAMPSAADGGGAKYLWLGASDLATEGVWNWVDGSGVSGYTNWGSGTLGTEPDNYMGVQDAMAMGFQAWPQPSGGIGTPGEWNDVNAADSLFSVIEWDYVAGTSGDDDLDGTGGDDSVNGLAGSDWVDASTGNDTLDGGAGYDMLSYMGAPVGFDFNLAAGTVQAIGGGKTDQIANFEEYFGTDYADSFTGTSGDDFIEARGGDDTLVGGAGFDFVSFRNAAAGVTASLAGDTALGGAGFDQLSGFEGIRGSAYADSIQGDAGDNVLEGMAGNDTLDGGLGIDTLGFKRADSAVQVNLATGAVSGGDGVDVISGFEDVRGSLNYADTLTGDAQDNTIEGMGGNDSLVGGLGGDTASYKFASGAVNVSLTSGRSGGADGTDTLVGFENLRGSAYADILTGNGADNIIEGMGGNDTLTGGAGADTLSYRSAGAGVSVNLTSNVVSGGAGADKIAGFENLRGSAYADTLVGNTLANLLKGGDGNDCLVAGAGNDTLIGGAGADKLFCGDGNDTLVFNDGDIVSGEAASKTSGGLSIQVNGNVDFTKGSFTSGTGFEDYDLYLADGATLTVGNNPLNQFKLGSHDLVLHADQSASVDVILKGTAGNDVFDISHFVIGEVITPTSTVFLNGGGGVNTWNVGGSDDFRLDNVALNLSDAITFTNDFGRFNMGGGNDVFVASARAETLDAGAGSNTVDYHHSTAGVNVNLGTGVGAGGYAAGDRLTNVQNVVGSGLADTLLGSTGDNVLEGGAGNDSILAGAGVDTASYASAGAGVTVNLNSGRSAGGAGLDTLGGFENILGSAFGDTLTGSAGNNSISAGAGNDSVLSTAGNDTLDGGDGVDTLSFAAAGQRVGTNVDDSRPGEIFYTLDGDWSHMSSTRNFEKYIGSAYGDELTAAYGNCTLLGGAGNDFFYNWEGNDLFDGGADSDTAYYRWASAALTVNLSLTGGQNTGGAGVDTLVSIENAMGGSGNDSLTGNAGNNSLEGWTGNDTLLGGAGDDILYGGLNNDLLNGGAGIDTVDYSQALNFYALTVNLAQATAQNTGGEGTDTFLSIENLLAGTGNDSLSGSSMNNVLVGNAGNDTLSGSTGMDCLLGGDGSDRLVLGSGNGLALGGAGADVLSATVGNAVLAGGTGNDTLSTGAGANVILFNQGDGMDIVNPVDTTRNDTVSLGGGISRSDLTLSKSGTSLVLKSGTGEGLTFLNWYAGASRTSVLNLQLIEAAASDYNPASIMPIYNSKVLRFDFAAIVAEFDAALASNPALTSWAMAGSMFGHLTTAWDSTAIGGDLAFQYGMTDGLAAVGSTGALNVLSGGGFGTGGQAFQTDAALGAGSLKLG